ncbi:MAG: prolipoprotein diacylglyceryl transferase [Christensenellaceae bacterium]|nr:prolipoprotein diacylglyceryl transferase [Christensenellaceae bacterium]
MCPVIHVFGAKIPSYGLMLLAGLLLGCALYLITAKKYSFDRKVMLNMLLFAVVGGFIGSKLLFIIVEWDKVFVPGAAFMNIINSGYVFYGGFIGAALMILLYAKKSGRSIYELSDTFLPCLCLAHAVGRAGCFLAGCCYGCETKSSIGVYFPEGGYAPSGIKILPTQLFEAVFLLILAAVLVKILFSSKKKGNVTIVYLFAYSVWRFFIEFYRMDERGNVGILSTSQFISIFIFIFAVLICIFGVNNKRKLNKAINKETINNEKI